VRTGISIGDRLADLNGVIGVLSTGITRKVKRGHGTGSGCGAVESVFKLHGKPVRSSVSLAPFGRRPVRRYLGLHRPVPTMFRGHGFVAPFF